MAGLALGCGAGDELPSATTRPIGAAASHASEAGSPSPGSLAGSDSGTGVDEAWSNENRAPKLVGLQMRPADSLVAGREVWARGTASDPDGDATTLAYRWRVNGDRVDVEGEVFDTRALRGGDTVQVEVTASDGSLTSAVLASPVLTVENAPPLITSTPGAPSADGVFRYELAASDPDGDSPLRYRLETGPPGMTVTPAAGEVQWRVPPNAKGVYDVALAVEDPKGGVGFQRFRLTLGASGD